MKEAKIMQAILYVAHGTRLQAGVDEARNFISHHMAMVDVPIQVMSFIDLASPLMAEGVEQCVKQGATSIAVIPILLLEAGHAKHDLPEMIRVAKSTYPHVNFTYGSPFGVQETIVDVMVQRMKEESPIEQADSVLIVGRGSSDESICKDFGKIATLLRSKINVRHIDVSYLAAQHPKFEVGLIDQLNNDSRKIFVLPYLLFNGLLMEYLAKRTKEVHQPNKEVILCKQLGLSEEISEVFIQNIYESITGRSNSLAI